MIILSILFGLLLLYWALQAGWRLFEVLFMLGLGLSLLYVLSRYGVI